MVFYFTSDVASFPATIYMGKDKFENEDLIKYGFPEDVWFHVDRLSSAHVYLRLQRETPFSDWQNIPELLLKDLAQLTKANSIEGNKKNNVTIVYTPWSNLKKTQGMETGQVSFHNHKMVKKISVEKRENDVINRLNKTKEERYPDLAAERLARDLQRNLEARAAAKSQRETEMQAERERKAREAEMSYDRVIDERAMMSNKRYETMGDVDPSVLEEDFSTFGATKSRFQGLLRQAVLRFFFVFLPGRHPSVC